MTEQQWVARDVRSSRIIASGRSREAVLRERGMARMRPRDAQGMASEETPIARPSAVKQMAQCSTRSGITNALDSNLPLVPCPR